MTERPAQFAANMPPNRAALIAVVLAITAVMPVPAVIPWRVMIPIVTALVWPVVSMAMVIPAMHFYDWRDDVIRRATDRRRGERRDNSDRERRGDLQD